MTEFLYCISKELIEKEIQLTIDIFTDNGHDCNQLKNITQSYTPPDHKTNNTKTKDKRSGPKPTTNETETINLFDELPFKCETQTDEEYKPFACIGYIPEIAPQIKRILNKAGVNTIFTAAPKLKDLLCSKNKTRPNIEKRKGVYKYKCPCNVNSTYVGQTARSYEMRWKEHGTAITKQQWSHSGISQHYEHCQEPFDCENLEPVVNMQGKKKKKLAYGMRVHEALKIRRPRERAEQGQWFLPQNGHLGHSPQLHRQMNAQWLCWGRGRGATLYWVSLCILILSLFIVYGFLVNSVFLSPTLSLLVISH